MQFNRFDANLFSLENIPINLIEFVVFVLWLKYRKYIGIYSKQKYTI